MAGSVLQMETQPEFERESEIGRQLWRVYWIHWL